MVNFQKKFIILGLIERVLEPAQFEESQRLSMRKKQLQRGVIGTSFVTPSEYRRYLNLVGRAKRSNDC